ncbi:hypothetical protein RSOLAG1IB_06225 [Rhizoctonia solani AG-1 IB]|uniref:Uncharacterized protein n=1 Tax=Thanatephorus cucumeris (strain AG1-IB / isolate 7/3/14) TaxID=1108050 RepID=A0A0B7F8N0_THACB|nr:hypothetical protein RSOLAG1IB_06225 [Rhizoctonia solani AG-1 IB]
MVLRVRPPGKCWFCTSLMDQPSRFMAVGRDQTGSVTMLRSGRKGSQAEGGYDAWSHNPDTTPRFKSKILVSTLT